MIIHQAARCVPALTGNDRKSSRQVFACEQVKSAVRQTSSEGPGNDSSKRRCPTTQTGGQRGCHLGWRRWRRRREQILQAAQKLFAEKGFRQTNLNDVATQLGFRRQAVYHYFRSKDQIPYELIDRAGQAIATCAQSTLDADMPPTNKIAESSVTTSDSCCATSTSSLFSSANFSSFTKSVPTGCDGTCPRTSASIANVIKEGQKDGTFSTYRPRRRYTCDSSRGDRRWRRRRLAEAYAAAACSTASKVAALCSAW